VNRNYPVFAAFALADPQGGPVSIKLKVLYR
jgi:hypothetical protein